MTKKSAARIKLADHAKHEDLPPIEETFENAKQMFLNTLKVNIDLAKRVDNLMNIRDYAIKFWGSELELSTRIGATSILDYYKGLQDISIAAYQAIYEATEKFELDEFLKEDMKDYYEEIIPKVDDIDTIQELAVAGLIFLSVKPYGEKMTSLHHSMLDEKAQRDFEEGTS